MKHQLIINSKVLLQTLSSLKGNVPSNPVIPILENFLFEAKDQRLSVMASDLQITTSTNITFEGNAEVNVCVPAKMLIDTLKNLPEQPITLMIDAGTNAIELLSDNGRYQLAGEDAGDFPRPTQKRGVQKTCFEAHVLLEALHHTLPYVSDDEMKPAMNGVFVHFEDINVMMAATDSHRLSKYPLTVNGASSANGGYIMTGKGLAMLQSLIKENADVTISFSENNAFIEYQNYEMVMRLIDERYPDYENVIPTNNDKILRINRQQLIGSLKRISIYANKTSQQIRFKLDTNKLMVSAEDVDFSNEAKETLTCDYESDALEIGFNGKFLLEMLSNIKSDTVTFAFSEPNRAAILTYDVEGALLLVMPVMLNNYY